MPLLHNANRYIFQIGKFMWCYLSDIHVSYRSVIMITQSLTNKYHAVYRRSTGKPFYADTWNVRNSTVYIKDWGNWWCNKENDIKFQSVTTRRSKQKFLSKRKASWCQNVSIFLLTFTVSFRYSLATCALTFLSLKATTLWHGMG